MTKEAKAKGAATFSSNVMKMERFGAQLLHISAGEGFDDYST